MAILHPITKTKKFWMTNEKSKKIAHQIRSERNIILVGNKTVIKDNPFLTDRYVTIIIQSED